MQLRLLLYLYERNGFSNGVQVTTPALAKFLNTSQQSASRIMIKMEREGFIERRMVGRSCYVRLTEKSINELSELYAELKRIIEKPVEVVLEGRVFSGMGEGAYYISLPWYREQIRKKLGFDPYPGTLNVNLLSWDSIQNRRLVSKYADIWIEGFRDRNRTYGGARAILASFNNSDLCAILYIERTHYGENVIELISPVYLRGKYGLSDGDKVKITVTLPTVNFSATGQISQEDKGQILPKT
jgi:riboflavin kinase